MKYYRGFLAEKGAEENDSGTISRLSLPKSSYDKQKIKSLSFFFPHIFQYGILRHKKLFVGMRSVRNCVGRALFEQFWATRNSTVYRAGTGLINWEATASLPAAAAPSIPAKKRCIFLRWSIRAVKLWLKQNCKKNFLKWNQRREFIFFWTKKTG